ncbi:MAG TPA: hypothetical protein VM428_02475 [Microlunatus sp.]|nr:hypothetical protein [Microlunatus sp.]
MDRRHFVATVGVASAAVAASAVLEENWAQAEPRRDPDKRPPAVVDDRFLDTLTRVNDLQVPASLAGYQDQIDTLASPRALAQSAMRLVSAYVNPRAAHHHAGALLGPIATLLGALAERQNPSGLYDIGNLDSPPDTSFVIADLGLSYVLLADDDQPATAAIRSQCAAIMRKAGTALAEGGVHTPNHRWEIGKALAHLNHLWPNRLLKARINDWLGEGIDVDDEGEYSERSPNYASEVTNKSLLTIARYADKPELRTAVRRNLQLTLYRIQPNGEVETVQSRRQDQTGIQDVWKYLTHYRELAIRDRNGQFAAVAAQILDRVAADPASFATSGYSVGEFLAEALAYPDITAVLPTSTPVPTTYTKTSKGSQLVSLRRGATTAVVFGGTDWHNKRVDSQGQPTSIREIASGLSTNPTFFKYRKGAAILDSVRLSPRFFSTGHFRSDGVTGTRAGWRLSDEVAVAYHLPLPQRRRRADGAYVLGSEGRFYSRMDFPHRPKDEKVLETTILITEVGTGGFDLAFDLDGPPTSLTIELCFRSGGTLAGVVPASGDGSFQLVEGEGSYTVGGDMITFGPGTGSGIRQPIAMDPGEKYTYLGGNLTPSGQRVYLTGLVPFRYTLRLR